LSIPSCPLIPASRNPAASLAAINAALDNIDAQSARPPASLQQPNNGASHPATSTAPQNMSQRDKCSQPATTVAGRHPDSPAIPIGTAANYVDPAIPRSKTHPRNENSVSTCELRAPNFPRAHSTAGAPSAPSPPPSALKNSSSISPALAAALAGVPDPP
jgi:hypothetical protein